MNKLKNLIAFIGDGILASFTIENYDKIQPIKMALPFTIRIEFNRSDYCDEACRNNPNIKRLDVYNAETVKTEIKEWKDVLL